MIERVTVIAEAGVNHNGDLGLAKRLVEAAAAADADLVKFQTFRADRLAVAVAPKADYQKVLTGSDESQVAMLKGLELSDDMHVEIQAHCAAQGIDFFSTGFDVESINFLYGLGQRRFKVPSGEITNLPLMRRIGCLGLPVILSTGMSTLDEVAAALDVLESAGARREQITILHCTTEYPTPYTDVNLRAMETLRQTFGTPVGYSDHTQGIEVAVAAVALGATMIEKHFTLDRSLPGPDHQASLEPDELTAMVTAIRHIEAALGQPQKVVAASEAKNLPIARKSIVAKKAIARGEVLREDNLTVKRPGTGLSPMRWDEVIGTAAARDFAPDDAIEV